MGRYVVPCFVPLTSKIVNPLGNGKGRSIVVMLYHVPLEVNPLGNGKKDSFSH